MPTVYLDEIINDDPNSTTTNINTKEVRVIEHSGNKWRARETPSRFMGLKNESQELFDSGFIGDDGVDNKDMRIKTYNGGLYLETNALIHDTDSIGKSNIVLQSIGNVDVNADKDIVLTNGYDSEFRITARLDYILRVINNYIEEVSGNKFSTIDGVQGYTRTVKNNTIINSNNDYQLNVGQNFTASIDNMEQHNSKTTTFNNSYSFNVNSEDIVGITGNELVNIISDKLINIESKDRVVIKGLSLAEEISNTININCKRMANRVDTNYELTANNMVFTALNDYTLTVNGNYKLNVKGDNTLATDSYELDLRDFFKVSANNVSFIGRKTFDMAYNEYINIMLSKNGIDINGYNNTCTNYNIDGITTNSGNNIILSADKDIDIKSNNGNLTLEVLNGDIKTVGKTVEIDTTNRGPIYLKVGSQYIDLDGCIIRVENGKLTINAELQADKVWGAVYN